ncbi:MAG: response regulator transcription factor [Candidatus Latescibacteria bacterium]|jgi:DNA-binding response OmpR family regulator|nr:response regulator transcription factor [Candidatus Latescibacterota bacterium]
MAQILLLADEAYGARLKSDLGYIGHQVDHVPLRDHLATNTTLTPADTVELIVIAPEASPERIGQILNRVHHQDLSLLVITDEMTALNLDFSLGIDDFIITPYSLRELEARLRLSLWNDNRPVDEHTIKLDDLSINLIRYEVRVKGVIIELTLKEYELLKHLVTHQGRVFTRSDLLDSIWGYDYYGGMRTVDVHIRRLRSKLDDIGDAIATVRGVGYKFDLR